MCGLIGAWGRAVDRLPDAAVQTALDQLFHRGPDDGGLLRGAGWIVGHRRLSILDLTAAGHQPMVDPVSGSVIVFNGEIYNFRELRAELTALGHHFQTACDTEVLLKAWDQWQQDCLPRLMGMFAFAIIEPARGRLFLARDRLGKKPLYVARDGDSVLFGSEVRALRHLLPSTTIAGSALASYLMYRYPVGSESFFNEIEALPGGHWLLADRDGVRRGCYWDVAQAFAQPLTGSDAEVQHAITATLQQAVQQRLVADVEVGAYLSGGVDSSGVVALMAALQPQPVHTFCAGFAEADFNEFDWARRVAVHCGTRHTEIAISADDYDADLPLLIERRAAPLSVPNEIALYRMSLQLARHVRVVLSGEGADELFSGYGRLFRLPVDHARYHAGTSAYRSAFELQYGAWQADEAAQFLAAYRYVPGADVCNWLHVPASVVDDQLGHQLTAPYFTPDLADFGTRISHFFLKVHLPGLLARLDFTSMQASVEARNPFLDHRLVELAARIPAERKIAWLDGQSPDTLGDEVAADYSERRDMPKALLKRALEPWLPHDILYRRKMGFPVPLRHWFDRMSREHIIALLCHNAGASADWINWTAVARWIEALPQPLPAAAGQRLWMLYNLRLFLCRHA